MREIYADESTDWHAAAPGEVIAWREIEAEPEPEWLKVGQRVRVKENPRGAGCYEAGDIGTITEDYPRPNSECRYRVIFPNDWWWCYADDLEPLPDDPEPQPDPKPAARYCVAADLPTTITVWHGTRAEAEAEAMRLYLTTGKAFRVLRVVFEIKPGQPVVTKWED